MPPLPRSLTESVRDLAPIAAVIAFFQLGGLGEPVPDMAGLVSGTRRVLAGLALFVSGLELGPFPIGEFIAPAFARKGSVAWLLSFSFAPGFGTTVAEPSMTADAPCAGETGPEPGGDDGARRNENRRACDARMVTAAPVRLRP